MITKVLRHPITWAILILTVLSVLAGQFGLAIGQVEQAPEEQAQASGPITLPYSHNVHVEKVGVQCLFCHSDALRSPQAGLPSIEKCLVCHASITVEGEQAQERVAQVLQAYEDDKRVQWPDVYKQPDFVYFSHRPHLAKGVSCQTCHGDVQKMDIVEKTVDMNMGFCLDCHRKAVDEQMTQEQEELVAALQDRANLPAPHEQQVAMPKLLDCATCHK